MNKEFVPYEQSLDLKELGFDEACFTWYWDDIGLYRGLEYDNHNKKEHIVSAPLYQQAFRWLLLLVNKDKHFTNKWKISYDEDYYSLFLGGCNMEVFKAELDCIKYLIEIVKNK